MNCARVREWRNGLLVAEPDEPLPTELAEHLEVCPRCRREHEVATQVLASIRPSHRVEASRQLKERIMSNISEMSVMNSRPAPAKGRRINLWKPVIAMAVALLLCVPATVFFLHGSPGSAPPPIPAFSLLSKAWAAEEATFAAGGIVHLVNQIAVKPISDPTMAQARWFPLMALDATGKPRFHQLALGAQPGEKYTVDDEVWYDPATGRFMRVLSAGGTPLFGNSYDGSTVYSLESGPDGSLHVVADPAAEGFHPPESPAAFLGIGVGLPCRIDESDKSLVSYAGEARLDDGSWARVITSSFDSGNGAPAAMSGTYFSFKVRESDDTMAEIEWVANGESALVIRRTRTETLDHPEVRWDLAQLESLLKASAQAPKPRKPGLLGVSSDMVISGVSVQHMVEKADFETYVFRSAPPWAGEREITDILDVASPPHRMFAISYRADDGRHVVLVQSYSYNAMAGAMVKTGNLVYESPNGVKTWGGPRGKWLAGILLKSARAVIKDPPSEDCTGYFLETPSGTYPALAINGQVTEQELHALIDNLVPAKKCTEK